MTRLQPQTWDTLAEVLEQTEYTRDPDPRGRGYSRFQMIRRDAENYAVLYIFTHNPNTYRPEEIRHTRHEFVVPVATYRREAWVRWVFDRIVSIEIHETCESFQVDGVRVYAPHHGNGWDPYTVWHPSLPGETAKSPGQD